MVSILKILGIIILCILAILLLLILLVLFAPIRYDISADYDKGNDFIYASVRVRWLLIIGFILEFADKKLKYRLKLLFINIINSEKKAKKQADDKEAAKAEDKPKAEDSTAACGIKAEYAAESSVQQADKAESRTQQADNAESRTQQADNAQSRTQQAGAATENKKARKNGVRFQFLHPAEIFGIVIDKIIDIIDGIRDTINSIIKNLDKVCRFITDEANRELLVLILTQLKNVLKGILPRKHSIYVKLGLADPSVTGQALGAYSVIKHLYNLNFVLEPDFDQEAIEVKASFKGRIRLISVLIAAIRIYCNKTFRKLIGRKK